MAESPESPTSRSSVWGSVTPRQAIGGVLAALAVTFVLQNTSPGRVSFLWWDVTAPAWTWLVVVFVVGVVVGSVFPWFGRPQRH